MKNNFPKNALEFCLLLCILIFCQVVKAQPFSKEIEAFKKSDSLHFPNSNQILFIGSSSFTKWKDVQNYFPKNAILNRGFGGSTLVDVIYYQNEIIYSYNPKQILIYCGENDIASSDSISANIILERFKTLFNSIRNHYPKIPIAFISLKPSPLRWQMKERMIDANKKIKNFLGKKKKTKFINIWDKMLDANGLPMKDIFIEDNLHMNAKGYSIWQKEILPILLD